jgi:DNA-binding MarR family transcriptional regulator
MSAAAVPTRADLATWIAFLRTHSAIKRRLNADLLEGHDLTLTDYEVLLRLANAEGRLMRRVDLADSVQLTASGITRLLDGLERAGYVEKAACASRTPS